MKKYILDEKNKSKDGKNDNGEEKQRKEKKKKKKEKHEEKKINLNILIIYIYLNMASARDKALNFIRAINRKTYGWRYWKNQNFSYYLRSGATT